MRTSRLAVVAIVTAMASTGAVAADATRDQSASTGASARYQLQAGERARFVEQEKAQLERQGFPQYNY